MMNEFRISTNSRFLTDNDFLVFAQSYASNLPVENVIKISDLNAAEKTALDTLMENLNFRNEESFFIWEIAYDDKAFDLSKSIIRDDVDLSLCSEMPISKPLIMIFEVPGFVENEIIKITLFYDDDFLTTDLTALEAIGVEIIGNGKSFSVVNTREIKISFEKPELITDDYLIDFKPVIL
jgi:hypothetical protein